MPHGTAAPRWLRLRALAAAGALAATALTACTGGSDAVDQSAGGDFRFVGATPAGKVIAAKDRKTPGKVGGDLLSGGTYTLTSDKGKVVVLNFFASWCGPCKVETPQLQQLSEQTTSKGVQVVGLDVKDEKSKASSFLSDNKITYPVVFDEAARTALQLGRIPLSGLPSTVVIDKQGRVAAVYVGAVQPADLEPAITSLLAEK